MMRTRALLASLCAGTLAAMLPGGCALYTSPRLGVTDARLTERSADGLVVTFTVEAANPNRVELPLRDIRYTLWLDGRRVFSGTRSAEATLARLSRQELTIPAAARPDALPRAAGVVPYRIRGELTYRTPGKLAAVLFDTGVPAPTSAFSHEGVVDLGPAPGSALER